MWRDILLIICFVLAGLTYFGLTPRRLAKYAGTVKVEVARRMTYRRVLLCTLIVISIFLVFFPVYRFNELTFDFILLFPVLLIFLWHYPLKDFLKSSKRGTKIVDALLYLGLALLITSIVLEDASLRKKIAYLGAFGAGLGARLLFDYVGAKLKSRRSSKEGNK